MSNIPDFEPLNSLFEKYPLESWGEAELRSWARISYLCPLVVSSRQRELIERALILRRLSS